MRYSQFKFNRGRYGTADLHDGASALTANSSVANVVAERIQHSGAISAGVSVVASVANLTSIGASAITSTVTSACVGQITASGSASATATNTTTALGQRVLQGVMTDSFGIYGISTVASNAELIYLGAASFTSTSTVTAKGGYTHTANVVDVSTSSSVVSVARLKWTPITEGAEVWTIIAA
jgi:hypothetical protein